MKRTDYTVIAPHYDENPIRRLHQDVDGNGAARRPGEVTLELMIAQPSLDRPPSRGHCPTRSRPKARLWKLHP